MSDEGSKHLRLFDALVRWCDPELVECVRQEERKLIAYELQGFGRPKITPPAEWAKPTSTRWQGAPDCTFLYAAWHNLENDFIRRIEIGELYLEGVRSTPDPGAQPEAIPNAWAADLVFDFHRNTVTRGEQRYLAISVSPTPSPWIALDRVNLAAAEALPLITEANVRELSDQEVLTLLEDHARRVVEGPDAKLIAPGKVSLMPIVRRKMQHRYEHSETRETLGAEASALADWIATKVPSHQAPTSSTIERTLRRDYRRPDRRSKAEIG